METKDVCPVCLKPWAQCECCPECAHICPLDMGELFCPVCKPEPKKPETDEK